MRIEDGKDIELRRVTTQEEDPCLPWIFDDEETNENEDDEDSS